MLIQMWRSALGVNVIPDPIDFNKEVTEVDATRNNPQGLQMWLLAWGADYPDPQDWTTLQFGKNALDNAMNYGQNNTADALQEQTVQSQLEQADAESNPTTRIQLYDNAEQQLINQVAWIPLIQFTDPILVKAYVHGYVLDPIQTVSANDWVNIYTGP
jgi:peptide/nickel transport system substrate-binding protein/oligopeptide transport system substrate-binding protein